MIHLQIDKSNSLIQPKLIKSTTSLTFSSDKKEQIINALNEVFTEYKQNNIDYY